MGVLLKIFWLAQLPLLLLAQEPKESSSSSSSSSSSGDGLKNKDDIDTSSSIYPGLSYHNIPILTRLPGDFKSYPDVSSHHGINVNVGHGQGHGHSHSSSSGSGSGSDLLGHGHGLHRLNLDRLHHAEARFHSFIERLEIGLRTGVLSRILQALKLKFEAGEINLKKYALDFNQTSPLTLQNFIAVSSDDAHFLMDRLHGRLDALGNHMKGFSLPGNVNLGWLGLGHGGHGGGHNSDRDVHYSRHPQRDDFYHSAGHGKDHHRVNSGNNNNNPYFNQGAGGGH